MNVSRETATAFGAAMAAIRSLEALRRVQPQPALEAVQRSIPMPLRGVLVLVDVRRGLEIGHVGAMGEDVHTRRHVLFANEGLKAIGLGTAAPAGGRLREDGQRRHCQKQ